MATKGGSRDVKITLSVDTLGEEGIKSLQKSVEALAREGGEAGPKFQQLADEIKSLGQQTQALTAFEELANDTQRLTSEQQQASVALKSMQEGLKGLQAASNAAALEQRAVQRAIADAKKEGNNLAFALDEIKAAYKAGTMSVIAYRDAVRENEAAQLREKNTLIDKKTELREVNAALREAVSEEKKLEDSLVRSSSALDRTNAALVNSRSAMETAGQAARELGVNTENIAAEQIRLVGELNKVGTAADAVRQDMLELAEADRLLVIQQNAMAEALQRGAVALNQEKAALADAERLTQRLAQETRDAAAVMENAFRQVGVRGLNELQADLAQTRAAMDLLRSAAQSTGQNLSGAFSAGAAKINEIERQIRELNGTLTIGDRAAKLFANSMGQIAAGNVIADGVGFLVNKVKELGVEFFSTNLQLQRLQKALGQIYGDTRVAGQQLQFLRDTANNSGISVGALSDAFVRFSAATRASGIPLETINGVFGATARAAGVLGLTNEQVTGTIEALGQMASKGTVSMEELRQQLGDRLPGALSIAAKGLGVTESKLVDMVSTGNLTTRVFFPAFEKGLNETFSSGTARVEGFIQAWNRLKNAVSEVAQRASDSSFFTGLGKVMDLLATNINGVVTAITLLTERYLILKGIDLAVGFMNGAKAAAVSSTALTKETVATVANTQAKVANTAAQTANAAAFQAIAASLNLSTAAKVQATAATSLFSGAARGLLSVLGGLPGALILTVLNAKELGTWIGETAAKFTTAGRQMKEYEAAMLKQTTADKAASEEKRRLANEQDLLNLKVAEAAIKDAKAAELAVISAEKRVKARQAEIEKLNQWAQIAGTEQAQLAASAQATDVLLAAQTKLSAARADFVEKTEAEIAAIERTRDAQGKLTEKQQESVTKLKEQLEARKAESDEAKATVETLELEAIQRRLMTDLYQDNSNRIDELREAYENARSKVEALTFSGVATARQLSVANAELAAASRRVSDAYSDQTEKIRANNALAQANASIKTAGLSVEQSSYESLARTARAQGDLAKATYYEIEAKNRQIEMTRLAAQAKITEANASIAAAEAERSQATAAGTLTEVKRLQIETTIASARAKIAEAKASEDQIRAMEAEKVALRDNTAERMTNVNAINAQSEALRKYQERMERYKAPKDSGLTSDGLKKNEDGSAAGTFNNNLPIDQAYAAMFAANTGTKFTGDPAVAQQQAAAQQAWIQAQLKLNPGAVSTQAVNDSNAMVNAANNLRQQQNAGVIGSGGGPVQAASKTVNINLNGRPNTSINTTSSEEADKLTRFLRGLETASGSAM